MVSYAASFKDDTNFNNLSNTLSTNYTNSTDLAANYLSKTDGDNFQSVAGLDAAIGTAGYVKADAISAAVSGLQTAPQVQTAIDASLAPYQTVSALSTNVANLGFITAADVDLSLYQLSANLDSNVSGLGYVKSGDVVAPSSYSNLKAALKPLVQALADSVNLLDAEGNAFNFAPLIAQLV
jgi:hypothetical protein